MDESPTRQVPRPRTARNAEGVDIWHIGEHSPMVPLGHTAVAGWKEPFPAGPKNMDGVPAAAVDSKARLAYMDEIGIWAQAIYPNVGGFGNQAFLKLGDEGLMLEPAYRPTTTSLLSGPPSRRIV